MTVVERDYVAEQGFGDRAADNKNDVLDGEWPEVGNT